MAIVTPPVYTGVHEEELIQNSSELQSFSEETYLKIAQNNNWLIDLRPIGTISFIEVNIDGGGTPDSSIWQECNGSEITNVNSPLRSIGINNNFVPDLRDRYIRCHSGDTGNPQAGSQIHNFQHDHLSGGPSSVGPGLEEKGDRNYRIVHGHPIAIQYPVSNFFDSPAFVYTIAYMKVV